jgi:hypothetical protein
MLHSQACDGPIFWINMDGAMAQTADPQFFQKVLPACNASAASCAFSDLACRGRFELVRRMQAGSREPGMIPA